MTALALLLLLAADPASPAPAAPAAPPAQAAPAAASPAQRFEQANALYLAGDFDGAARAYRALVDQGYESVALHHNLGNALVRAGARGQAMASYERALRLDPQDEDARANLEAARAQNVDRLVGAAEPSLGERLVARTGDVTAVALFGAAWTALWALLWLRGRSARRARRWLGAAALAAALGSVAAGALLTAKATDRRTPAAVVVAPSAAAREGPERALKPAFEVHEGTRVRVLEARGDRARVKLENGLTGWVAAADLEII